jgi:TonB family protein
MLAGRVVDSTSRQPIAGARIRLQRISAGAGPRLIFRARADSAGVFYASVTFAGRYLVTFRPPGSAPTAPIEADLGQDEVVQAEFLVPRHPVDPDSVYDDEEVDSPVALVAPRLSANRPRYPQAARARGEEATVQASFVVDTTGRVAMSSVRFTGVRGLEFEEAVREWLATARYTPARSGTRPVRARVVQPFEFRLEP